MSKHAPPTTLPIARYRFTATAQDAVTLPSYAGSLLRGQFGASLRRLACMTRAPSCAACPLLQTCPYTAIFDSANLTPQQTPASAARQSTPNPYIVEPPLPQFDTHAQERALQAGQKLVFTLVLLGPALNNLALVLYAFERALAHGLTRARCRLTLTLVELQTSDSGAGQWQSVWEHTSKQLLTHQPHITLPQTAPSGSTGLNMEFITPLRIHHNGKPLWAEDLRERQFIGSVLRRSASLLQHHAPPIRISAAQTESNPDAETPAHWPALSQHLLSLCEHIESSKQLQWRDWSRYSSRQQREMTLGGALGHWQWRADKATLDALYPWLYLAQWLHIGKNATMGMGQMRLSAI